jgi:nucleotide-binding universal stress UspA family protein
MAKSMVVSINKILVPVDASPASEKALEYGVHLAKLENAKLSIVYVIDDIKMGGVIGARAKYGDVKLVEGYNRARKEWASEWMKTFEGAAKREQVETNSEILYALGTSEAEMIIDYARENKMDLIVMGTRGQSKFKKLLVGSIANKVFQHAHCPVFIVR